MSADEPDRERTRARRESLHEYFARSDGFRRLSVLLRDWSAVEVSPSAQDAYRHQIREILSSLAEHTYRRCLLEADSGAVAVLSYHTEILGFDSENKRISSLKAVPLTPSAAHVAVHVSNVIESNYEVVRQHLELHRLALQPIAPAPDTVPRRVPLAVTHEAAAAEDGHEPVFHLIDANAISADVLREAVARHRSQQRGSSVYPSEDLSTNGATIYADYLRTLLNCDGGHLHFYTVPISDELSHVAHGTVMIFSRTAVTPRILWELRDSCFEVFNAVHKLEAQANARNQTAAALLMWLSHEAGHWAAAARELSQHLRMCTTDGDPPGEPIRSTSDATGRDDRHGSIERIRASCHADALKSDRLSERILRARDVIGSLAFGSPGEVSIEELRSTCGAAGMSSDTRLTWQIDPFVSLTKVVPRALLLICWELVANAEQHSRAGSPARISVTLRQSPPGYLELVVRSQPHDKAHAESVAQLNEGTVDDILRNGTTRVGARLARQLARRCGGSLSWRWKGDDVVTAKCVVPHGFQGRQERTDA